ncbi:MAG: hypothetical protein J0L73_07700 [Verrucomicrobia bacterium]|nr:hypothetical protein [Verrucomicrobiota bacterium]
MKTILQLIGLGLFVATLSSCSVGGAGYVGAGPSYGHYHNGNYPNGYNNTRHYSRNQPPHHPGHYSRNAGANARVNARVAPLNVSSSTGLRLF